PRAAVNMPEQTTSPDGRATARDPTATERRPCPGEHRVTNPSATVANRTRHLASGDARRGLDGTHREEGVVDGLADGVELALQAVQEDVQPQLQDLVDLRVGQLGVQAAHALFRGVTELAHRRAADQVQRLLRLDDAVLNSPRELRVEYQEVDDLARRQGAVTLAVHLKARDRAEHARPLQVVDGAVHVGAARQQEERLHVEDARRLVGALHEPTEAEEVPTLPVGQDRIG